MHLTKWVAFFVRRANNHARILEELLNVDLWI
jgi:hypothetical protein